MDLIEALNYFKYKKVEEEGLLDYNDDDSPEMSTKKYAKIPEATHNSRISIPCHPEYLKFIYLNTEEDYFDDLQTKDINKIIKRVNEMMDEVIEEKNAIEFDNHYKNEDIALHWIITIGFLAMAIIYVISLNEIGNFYFYLILTVYSLYPI